VINGFQQSTLLFDAPPDHGASLLNYEFQLEPNGKWTPLNTTQSPLSLTNLTNGRVYHVRLRAVNILGAGPASEPVRLAPFGATVAAGQNYTLATRPSGTLYGWGTQLYGILGDGASNGSTLQPSTYSWGDTSAVPMFTKIVAGGTMAFGLDDQGQAWAWGNGHQGRLGLDGSQDTTRPVNMVFEGLPSGATIVDIAAGQSHGLALDSTGTIWGWGLTISYQLAKPGLNVSAPTPISLGSGIEITAITATIDTSFALDRDGGVWAWGAPGTNLFAGQSVTILQAPTRIVAGDLSAPFQSIDAGGSHVLAIDSDGHLWSWGDNSENQLSHAPTGAPGGPQKVTFAQGAQVIVGAPEGSTVIQVAAGEESSIALDSNGDVWTVGANDSGQLGKSTAPVYFTQVSLQGTGLQGLPVDVAAGPRHKVVIDAEGNAVSWGFNASGELGANSGFGANTDQPQDVKSPF
jgi:alpha-tubulin suppressor-like RCC1 family protein